MPTQRRDTGRGQANQMDFVWLHQQNRTARFFARHRGLLNGKCLTWEPERSKYPPRFSLSANNNRRKEHGHH